MPRRKMTPREAFDTSIQQISYRTPIVMALVGFLGAGCFVAVLIIDGWRADAAIAAFFGIVFSLLLVGLSRWMKRRQE